MTNTNALPPLTKLTSDAAARYARIAANFGPKNRVAMAAWVKEERAILSEMHVFASFNGGVSPELSAQCAAFKAWVG